MGDLAESIDPAAGKNLWTLLTDGSYPYWFQTGHDRGLVVIDEKKLETTVLQIKKKPSSVPRGIYWITSEKFASTLPWKHQSIRKLKIHSPSQSELRELRPPF